MKIEFDPEIEEALKVISKDKPENFSGCIEIEEYTDKDWEALKECNMRSDERVRFGRREVENQKGTLMHWSNNGARWFAQRPIKKGEKIEPLQANEIICPISKERAKRIACYIKELPLYYASLEAKFTGRVSSRQALDVFMEGHGISDLLDTFPLERRERIKEDIREKGWRWFLSEED